MVCTLKVLTTDHWKQILNIQVLGNSSEINFWVVLLSKLVSLFTSSPNLDYRMQ